VFSNGIQAVRFGQRRCARPLSDATTPAELPDPRQPLEMLGARPDAEPLVTPRAVPPPCIGRPLLAMDALELAAVHQRPAPSRLGHEARGAVAGAGERHPGPDLWSYGPNRRRRLFGGDDLLPVWSEEGRRRALERDARREVAGLRECPESAALGVDHDQAPSSAIKTGPVSTLGLDPGAGCAVPVPRPGPRTSSSSLTSREALCSEGRCDLDRHVR